MNQQPNQFSRWKYLLIITSVLLSLIYTLPNFYGEAPAVQIMSVKSGEKIDNSIVESVETTLKNSNITINKLIIENIGIKVKLESPEDQLKAKKLIQEAIGENYVVALNLLPNSPNWLSNIGALPLKLGLDLRGGVHFLMQLDMSKASDKNVYNLLIAAREELQKKRIPYYGSLKTDSGIEIKFKKELDRDMAKEVFESFASGRKIQVRKITKETAAFEFVEVNSDNEFILYVKPNSYSNEDTQSQAIKQNLDTLHNRINELGVAEPVIQQQGADRIVVQLPGVQDTAKAKDIIGRTAMLEMRMTEENQAAYDSAINGNVPAGLELFNDRDGIPVLVKKEVVLTGERITDAGPGIDNQTGKSVVSLILDGQGAKIFKKITRENVGKKIALILIDKKITEVITNPVIRGEIGGGRVQITGMENAQEATDISLLLRAGSLATPMEIVEERTVGPSMGKENIANGIKSTIWGFIAIVIMIAAYYMGFGLVSVVSLSVNLIFLVALLSAIQATLTLPGIAAITLTIGMAIDANVLINERIRDEIRNGNTPQASINIGYEKAWGTILDSNITTMIAGIALFYFGSGPIKGFAVVHVLGILTSMYSSIWVSRAIINYIYGRRRHIHKLSIGEIFKIDNN
ncbi:MAG: protein translocase subunit SecD [Methylophilaceae bacterium]|nr:protein translocase subunit SecD [Methylophilaceae bacterium]